jgi:hypothetical protein
MLKVMDVGYNGWSRKYIFVSPNPPSPPVGAGTVSPLFPAATDRLEKPPGAKGYIAERGRGILGWGA